MTAPPLRDYQEQGVNWLCAKLKQHKCVLLADQMGLGKSLQALRAAEQRGADRIMIICPAGARRVWQAEIERWLPDRMPQVLLIEPGVKLLDIKLRLDAPRVVLIVSYDEFSNRNSQLVSHLRSRAFDLLILDEAHYLKNPSNRTQAIYGVRGSGNGAQATASKVILLTGTPTPNHAGELWQHYRTFWPGTLKNMLGRALSQTEFEDRFTRYKDTPFGRQVTGSRNQKVLRDALGPMILRRRKDDVLPELPPLILQDIPLDAAVPEPGTLGRQALVKLEGFVLAPYDPHKMGLDDNELLSALRRPDTQIATARRELGLLKVQPTIAWVQERMLSVDKLLIFAWHHEVIQQLHKGLLEFGPVTVTGSTGPGDRAVNIERFQTRRQTRIFIGQILAAGTAITLTAASEVAICEPSWVPGENVQAIDRAHRLGQRDSVVASFLYLPGTLDERIMQTFRRKASEISQLQGDTYADQSQSDPRHGNRAGPAPVRVAAGSHSAYQRALGRDRGA